jgi:hypothetical protein
MKERQSLSTTIKTPAIAALVRAYELWYGFTGRRHCGCSEDTGKWPNNFVRQPNGLEVPAVCPLHEWQHKQSVIQKMLVEGGISMPLPRRWKNTKAVENIVSAFEPENPLNDMHSTTTHGASFEEIGAIASRLARNWSEFPYASGEHIIVLTNRTAMLSMMYERRDDAVKDTLLFSPVLVYWDNEDRRDSGEYIDYLISSRQKGITVINE